MDPQPDAGSSSNSDCEPSSSKSATTLTDTLSWNGQNIVDYVTSILSPQGSQSALDENARQMLLNATGKQLCDEYSKEDLKAFFEESFPTDTRSYKLVLGAFKKLRQEIIVPCPSQPTQPKSFGDTARLERQFLAEYRDPLNLVQSFSNYIEQCHDKFKKSGTSYFAPYITLVQSSGHGKSRLLHEVSKKFPTLYFNLRKPSSKGYPLRTENAIGYLFGHIPKTDRKAYQDYFKQRILNLVRRAIVMQDALMTHEMPSSSKSVDEVRKGALFPSERHYNELYSAEEVSEKVKADTSPIVLLVFDEARELLNIVDPIGVSEFRMIRQALREFSENAANSRFKLMSVFIDTSSKIQNFAPAKIQNFAPAHENDTSARDWSSTESTLKLFHPFILYGTFDLHWNKADFPALKEEANVDYLRAGRPLVAQESYEDQYTFLKYKLLGGTDVLSETGSLGTMLCRVAALVSPRHKVASDLVANHMATLLAYDSKCKATLSAYVAEPKLAIAAASQLWGNEEFFTKHGIPALQNSLLSGALSNGIRGEIAAQIILLLAFDSACQKEGRTLGSLVPLRSFLLELLPAHITDDTFIDRVIPEGLKNAKVACCQFVTVVHEFSQDTLLMLAARHCGAAMKEGQRGADLVIPIIGDERGFIMFQIKNLKICQSQCRSTSLACDDMLPSTVFENVDIGDLQNLDRNSVRIFMQVGARKPFAYVEPEVQRAKTRQSATAQLPLLPKPLQLFGLSPRCLATRQRYVEALTMLVQGSVNLEAYLTENACVDPKSDLDGLRIRMAWPFVVESTANTGKRAVPPSSGQVIRAQNMVHDAPLHSYETSKKIARLLHPPTST